MKAEGRAGVPRFLIPVVVLTLLIAVCSATFITVAYVLPRLREERGPIQLWFKPWDAEVPISDVAKRQEIVVRAKGRQPELIALRVSGEFDGDASLTLSSVEEGPSISLPSEMNRVHVYDWRGGDFVVAYFPGSATRGALFVRVKFGY